MQASAYWSAEHIRDSPERVQAKLLRAFADITGIRAEPAHVEAHRWLYAKTDKALGRSHLWKAEHGVGGCGDWCLCLLYPSDAAHERWWVNSRGRATQQKRKIGATSVTE